VELDARAQVANRNSRAVFVSIHFNASRSSAISGMEVFYRSSTGKTLARSILRSMDKRLIGKNRGLIYGNMRVLRATRMPAVLVEAAYLSNKKEARRYGLAENRQDLAEAIAAGIVASRG
jgi:N-acetylmuramoyl-L-alanine amidase